MSVNSFMEKGSKTKEIKLLVVEDSAFMRQLIKDLLSPYSNIKIDTAPNGKVAIHKIKEINPDVITLDIEMPHLNGFELLEFMQKENIVIPTIMLSRLTRQDGEDTIKALQMGAIDFITKPEAGFLAIELDKLGAEIYEKVVFSQKIAKKGYISSSSPPVKMKSAFIIPKILVIGASTGGPKALYEILSRLPALPIPVIVVQHMPAGFTQSLAKRLNYCAEMEVKSGEEGETLKPGTVYVAPGDYHLTVTKENTISLSHEAPCKGVRPSVDVTLNSVAEVFGGRVLSVILTGMGSDGTDGVLNIKKQGGRCIVQDKDSCVVFGMPESIIQANGADSVTPLDKIPEEIVHYLLNWY